MLPSFSNAVRGIFLLPPKLHPQKLITVFTDSKAVYSPMAEMLTIKRTKMTVSSTIKQDIVFNKLWVLLKHFFKPDTSTTTQEAYVLRAPTVDIFCQKITLGSFVL